MSLYPFAGAHAVQSAAFAIEWSDELSDVEVSSLLGLHEQLKPSLPLSAPLQSIQLQMSGNAQPVRVQTTAGCVFNRPGNNGPARTLEVARNRMVGQINDYTRWQPVWDEVNGWFSVVGPTIGKRKISSIGLQYNDVFHWRGVPQDMDLTTLFLNGSKLLPANVFEIKGQWHSHHGYFMDRPLPIQHRLLENINVNVLEELGERSFVITTVHKAEVSQIWGWEGLKDAIAPLMVDLHNRNKEVLSQLLSEHAKKMINLSKESSDV
jgi:uncharacterized protein (TIGR04255 family)